MALLTKGINGLHSCHLLDFGEIMLKCHLHTVRCAPPGTCRYQTIKTWIYPENNETRVSPLLHGEEIQWDQSDTGHVIRIIAECEMKSQITCIRAASPRISPTPSGLSGIAQPAARAYDDSPTPHIPSFFFLVCHICKVPYLKRYKFSIIKQFPKLYFNFLSQLSFR